MLIRPYLSAAPPQPPVRVITILTVCPQFNRAAQPAAGYLARPCRRWHRRDRPRNAVPAQISSGERPQARQQAGPARPGQQTDGTRAPATGYADAGNQPHGCVPQPGVNSSPAFTVWTGASPCPPRNACPVVSVKVKSPSTTSRIVRSASLPTAIAPSSSGRPSTRAALEVVALTTSASV